MMSPTWATGEQLFFKEGHFPRTTPPTGMKLAIAPPTGAPPTGALPTDIQVTPPIAHQQAATRSAEDLEKHCQKLEEKLQQYKEIAKGRENEIKVLKDDLAELKEKDKLREEEMKQLEDEVKVRDRELLSLTMKVPPSP